MVEAHISLVIGIVGFARLRDKFWRMASIVLMHLDDDTGVGDKVSSDLAPPFRSRRTSSFHFLTSLMMMCMTCEII